MKTLLSFLFVFASSLWGQDSLDVYLLIGQSNMAGRAKLKDDQKAPIEGVFLMNESDTWEPASNPLNRYSTVRKGLKMQRLGPGYAFALEMRGESSDTEIGLVVNAKGGSNIREWGENTRFYDEAVRRARIAQQTGTLKGVLWHQGESNHKEPENYMELLTDLINRLRKDLDAPELPFVAGQIKGNAKINEVIADLPNHLPFTAVATSEALTTFDKVHFDNASQLELGKRYATAMLQLLE